MEREINDVRRGHFLLLENVRLCCWTNFSSTLPPSNHLCALTFTPTTDYSTSFVATLSPKEAAHVSIFISDHFTLMCLLSVSLKNIITSIPSFLGLRTLEIDLWSLIQSVFCVLSFYQKMMQDGPSTAESFNCCFWGLLKYLGALNHAGCLISAHEKLM